MNQARKTAALWSTLSTGELAEQVQLTVKAHDARAKALWVAVAEDLVLAARVRGALAGLKAEFRGHRDEVMWLLWINQAQQQLAPVAQAQTRAVAESPQPVAVAEAPEVPEVALTSASFERPDNGVVREARDIPVMLFQEPPSAAG
ncbi:hypothetical protein FHS29_007298 [Saccharothrix tamanrassetensis]|uniref:Uncharacterized protein n=1 Tax=Saccharothrix tamanrassetensis TaxID=1051531 RepID=A0A841CTN8_9PSEU|nr:hypothetical protein [Saccharothrix tamanrassetensis]MBB5960670.1 hypothetical protein [Saccharothrix tamanrassetensis]